MLVFWGFTLSQIPTLKNVEKNHTSKLHFTTNITSYRASTQKQKIIIFHSPSRFGNHSLSAIPRKKEINIIYIISSSPKFCKTKFFQHKPNLSGYFQSPSHSQPKKKSIPTFIPFIGFQDHRLHIPIPQRGIGRLRKKCCSKQLIC